MDIQKIIFYNDKIVASIWSDTFERWEEINIDETGFDLPRFFKSTVEFAPDLTVRNFILNLSNYEDIINKCFEGSSLGFSIFDYIKVMEKPAKNTDIKKVEFYWASEITSDNEFYLYCSYHGRDENNQCFGLDINPINNWADCIFVLNKEFQIITMEDIKNQTWQNNPKYINEYTLYELLDGFIYNLTFYGNPQNQEDFIEEINSNIEQFDIVGILEGDLQKSIEEEDYEKANEIKKEIEKIKKNNFLNKYKF